MTRDELARLVRRYFITLAEAQRYRGAWDLQLRGAARATKRKRLEAALEEITVRLQRETNEKAKTEERARELASEAYHDHPSNPSSCERHLEHDPRRRCPCEKDWRKFYDEPGAEP